MIPRYRFHCITCVTVFPLFPSRYDYTLLYIFENSPKNINNLYNERTCIWLRYMPASVVEWMFKNSLECIRKFVESDYEIWVMCHIGDIVCWGCGMSGLSNVRDVECSGCGILGMWDIRNVRCSRCGMFGTWDVEMWDFGDIGCLGCRMFGMWNVRDVRCWDVRCSRRGMCGMWYVRDVGCWGCAMCDVCRDVRCWFT